MCNEGKSAKQTGGQESNWVTINTKPAKGNGQQSFDGAQDKPFDMAQDKQDKFAVSGRKVHALQITLFIFT